MQPSPSLESVKQVRLPQQANRKTWLLAVENKEADSVEVAIYMCESHMSRTVRPSGCAE